MLELSLHSPCSPTLENETSSYPVISNNHHIATLFWGSQSKCYHPHFLDKDTSLEEPRSSRRLPHNTVFSVGSADPTPQASNKGQRPYIRHSKLSPALLGDRAQSCGGKQRLDLGLEAADTIEGENQEARSTNPASSVPYSFQLQYHLPTVSFGHSRQLGFRVPRDGAPPLPFHPLCS